MATYADRLVRAIEILQPSVSNETTEETTSESIQSRVVACKTIVQCLSRLSVTHHEDYNELVSMTFENLLVCCNDKNSDVRVAADEGLNQLINELYGSESGRIQVELFREIKRNASPRRLKAAIVRFSELAHLIKPQKCRLYVMNLLPLLMDICAREEETIQESLITAMPKIVSVLGPFFSESELQNFLSTLFTILVSNMSSSRRMAAECITALCHNCLKPGIFYSVSLEKMLLLTVNYSTDSSVLIGGFLGLRKILVSALELQTKEEDQYFFNVDHISIIMINIFNVLNHGDHNVCTGALSCLQALVEHCHSQLGAFFLQDVNSWCESFTKRSLDSYLVGMNHSNKNMNLRNKNNDELLSFDLYAAATAIFPEPRQENLVTAVAVYLSKHFLVSVDEPLKNVRVSVKSLVLNCISEFMLVSPSVLEVSLPHLPKHFKGNCDPMLQENLMVLCSNYILNSLKKSYYREWKSLFDDYIQILIDAVGDESPKVHKAACDATKVCLGAVIKTCKHNIVIKLIEALLPLHKSSYWLVKTALLDVLKDVDFVFLSCFSSSVHALQAETLEAIFLMLSDEDYRVQTVAAKTLCYIVPHLTFTRDRNKTIDKVVLQSFIASSRLSNPPPYIICLPSDASQIQSLKCYHDNGSLSRILNIILEKMITSNSKDMVQGCIEAVACLSSAYIDVTLLPHWSVNIPSEELKINPVYGSDGTVMSTSSGLLSFFAQYLTSSIYMYDINIHQCLVTVITNLLSSTCKYLISNNGYTQDRVLSWSLLSDENLVDIIQNLLYHIIRVLNICCYVCCEEDPSSTAENIKEKINVAKKKKADESDEPSLADNIGSSKVGSFTSLIQYMKFYENLKASYEAHKVTLNLSSEEKFVLVLRSTLELFQQILKYSSLKNVGCFAEEVNEYLTKLMRKEPIQCITTTRYLLSALFGTNVICNDVSSYYKGVLEVNVNKPISVYISSPIHIEYFKYSPYIYQKLSELQPESDEEQEAPGLAAKLFGRKFQKNAKKKVPTKQPQGSVEMQHYIRYFEGNVMKSLELYTLTNNTQVQGEVLVLLIDLLRLRVNYALLDTDKVFVNFLLKQFEFIEQGQVREASKLLPTLFQFLIMLTKERYQNQEVIDIPRIMQLCGTAMASGQLDTASISVSLYPLIHELFLIQETANIPHLTTQREVVESILLKNVIHYQVIDILWIILNWYKPDDREFRRYSASVWVACTIAISQGRLDVSTVEVMTSMHRLLDVICYDYTVIISTLTDFAISAASSHTKVAYLCLLLRYVLIIAIRGKFDAVDALSVFTNNSDQNITPHEKLLCFLIYAVTENLTFVLESTKTPFASFASINYILKLVYYVRDKFGLSRKNEFQPEIERITELLKLLIFKYPHIAITVNNILQVLKSGRETVVSTDIPNMYYLFVCRSTTALNTTTKLKEILALEGEPIDVFAKSLNDIISSDTSYSLLSFGASVTERYLNATGPNILNVDKEIAVEALITLRGLLESNGRSTNVINKIDEQLTLLEYREEMKEFVPSDAEPSAEWLKIYLATDLCLNPVNTFSTVPVLRQIPVRTLKELARDSNFDTVLFAAMLRLGQRELRAQKATFVGPEEPIPQLPSLLLAGKHELLERISNLTGVKIQLPNITTRTSQGHKKSNSTSLPKSLALFVDTTAFTDVKEILEYREFWDKEQWISDLFNYIDASTVLLDIGILYSDLAYLDPYQVHSVTRLLALGLQQYRHHKSPDVSRSLTLLRFLLAITVTRDTCAIIYYGEEMQIIDNVHFVIKELFGKRLKTISKCDASDTTIDKVRSMVNFVLYDMAETNTHPSYVVSLVKKCILSLSSLPCVSSYLRIPSFLSLSSPKEDSNKEFTLSSIELDFLKDSEVLDDFLFRNLSFGWATKRQFEELWVTMLGMITYRFDSDFSLEEINELCVVNRLAIRGMTTLLMQTQLWPVQGAPYTSIYQHFPWTLAIPFLNTDIGQSMVYPHKMVHDALLASSHVTPTSQPYFTDISCYIDSHFSTYLIDSENSTQAFDKNAVFLHDIDRIPGSSACCHGYYGATALRERIITNDITDLDIENQEKTQKIIDDTSDEPDTNSCLHFLVDLFAEWTLPESQIPISLLNQIINSISQISDMFQKTSHCQWMVDGLMRILLEHPIDDKIVHSKLLYTLSKAISLLQADKAGEKLLPFIESALQSDFMPLHMAALNGSFYLLESQLSCFEGALVTSLADFISLNLVYDLMKPYTYVASMWAVAMVLFEKFPEECNQSEGFSLSVLQFGMNCLMNQETPFIFHQLVVRGFQRLVLSFSLPCTENESLIQIASSQLDIDNPQKCLSSFGLLMTCMYCGREGSRVLNLDRDPSTMDALLTGAMDKMRKILDCITHCCDDQARPLASVVCYLVKDFFPKEQMINTFVSAFLSPRQQNRHLISLVLQHLFQSFINEDKFEEIAEWVSLVLRNFVQLQPLTYSLWCTTILLLCSTKNNNLAVLLPHVLHHSNKPHSELFGLLCQDFYSCITERDQISFKEILALGGQCHTSDGPRNEFHLICESLK